MSSRELCIMACVFCRDPQFWAWIESLGLGQVGAQKERFNEAGAKQFILHACKVKSRNDLDRDLDAAQHFHEFVRKPFLAWKGESQ